MKRFAAVLMAGALLTGCAAPAPATPAGPSDADKRYEKCVKGATEDYRIMHGEAYYRANETKVNRMVADRCENARK